MSKQWSTAEKKLIVLEMLKGQKSVAQISKEYGISDSGSEPPSAAWVLLRTKLVQQPAEFGEAKLQD